jgi:uncharacterized membrane protein
MRISLHWSWVIVAVALILSLAFYNQVPERVDSHWDAQGRVNGTMSRFWGFFLLPVIMIGITLLLVYLPRIDPLNPNFVGFRQYYNAFILFFNIYMLLIHAYLVLWNANVIRFNVIGVVSVGTGLLLYAAGVLVKNAKRNWFAGIRTPWTLSSDSVWDKTHALGSTLFKVAGILICLSLFVPRFSIWIILTASLGVSAVTIAYSYIVFRQEENV